MATTGFVRVGDIGTEYRAKIQNNGVAFNILTAVESKLIWKMPRNRRVERTALIEQVSTDYFLVYTVISADVNDFHVHAGTVKWQGFVRFAGGEKYHTTIEEYKIEGNL